jgi:hypothetical protein
MLPQRRDFPPFSLPYMTLIIENATAFRMIASASSRPFARVTVSQLSRVQAARRRRQGFLAYRKDLLSLEQAAEGRKDLHFGHAEDCTPAPTF